MFYVYILTDPRDNSVFYVGKGQRNRLHQHTKDARTGKFGGNLQKYTRIRQILDAGLEPRAEKVAEFLIEQDAFDHECYLIGVTPGLTNMTHGGEGVSLPPHVRKYRQKKANAIKYWKIMQQFQAWLKTFDTWPGVTIQGMKNGDRMAQELVDYMRLRVYEWELLKDKLRTQMRKASPA